jgi:phosphoglycolate phosphatase
VITLVCLDLAGTLVSDDGLVEDAFFAALDVVRPNRTRDESRLRQVVNKTMGQAEIDVFRLVLGDEASAQAAVRAFEAHYEESVGSGAVRPLRNVVSTLEAIRERGMKLCATTSFSPATRNALFDALGWHQHFDLAVSPIDAGRGRPFPDMILSALVRLGIDDVRHVAVAGDTTSDLVAGTRAGASIVAGVLTGTHDAIALSAVAHTHILRTANDLLDVVDAAGHVDLRVPLHHR